MHSYKLSEKSRPFFNKSVVTHLSLVYYSVNIESES